jgi:hypothetical protein
LLRSQKRDRLGFEAVQPAPSGEEKPIDSTTLEALAILTEAVHAERMPGVIEFNVLLSALDDARRTGRDDALEYASHTFQAMDKECRRAIMRRACDVATVRTTRKRKAATPSPPASAGFRTTHNTPRAQAGCPGAVQG